MPPYTDKGTDVTSRLRDIIDAAKEVLGVYAVYYGDQNLIPDFPSVVCESMPKDRILAESGFKYHLTLRTGVIIYHGKIQASEITKLETETLAEDIEDLIMADNTLGGMIVHGYVSRIEPGLSIKNEVMLRASRLTYEAESRKQL